MQACRHTNSEAHLHQLLLKRDHLRLKRVNVLDLPLQNIQLASLVVDLGRLLAEEQDDGDLHRPAKKPRGRPPKDQPLKRTSSMEPPKKPRKKVKRKRPKDDSDDSDDDWGPGKN